MFIQLYRKNSPNKGRSETVQFIYKPNRFKRKIPCPPASIPTVVNIYENSNLPSSSSSPFIQEMIENDRNNNFASNTHSTENEHEDSEIINLILKISAEGYKSPTSDISSIVRDLRSGYEIDAVVPNAFERHANFSSPFKILKHCEKLFDILANTMNGDLYAFAELLEKGTIEDIQVFTVLIAKYKLTKALNSINDSYQNLLHLCILRGYINMFKLFVKLGVDVNHSDAQGQTPLHLAVIANFEECVKDLTVTRNLVVDKMNDQGETALYLSIVAKQSKLAKMLIEKGDYRKTNIFVICIIF